MTQTITESTIWTLPAGRHSADYHGLALLVRYNPASGKFSRTWVQRVRVAGRPTNAGIGSAKKVTLRQARAKARANAAATDRGRTLPHAPRAVSGTVRLFSHAVEGYIARKRDAGEWKGQRTEEQFRANVTGHGAKLLPMRIDAIESPDIYDALMARLAKKPATLHMAAENISSVFRWARGLGYVQDNPCTYLSDALPPKPKGTKRVAMAWEAVPVALRTLRTAMPDDYRTDALEFLILTATRTQELAGAAFEEFDMAGAVWTIPAGRMKKGREHSIPLCERAMELVRRLRTRTNGEYLVPGVRTASLDPQWFVRTLKKHGMQVDAHGFRASFGTWAEANGYPTDLITPALSHAKDKTTGAYLRGGRVEERRAMMAAWAKAIS